MQSRSWTVLCDFDGTLALEDVTDSLLLRFGRLGWEALEADWLAGRIGSRECMARQVALLQCSRAELCEHLSRVVIDDRFYAFAEALALRGWPLTVVSDGLDFAITEVLRRHGLGHLKVVANRLVADGPARWRLEFPHARPDCAVGGGNCKCARAQGSSASASENGPVLLIGDGASDFCVAARSDLVFARKRLLAHCQDRGIRHYAVPDFQHALDLLPELDSLLLPKKMPDDEPEYL